MNIDGKRLKAIERMMDENGECPFCMGPDHDEVHNMADHSVDCPFSPDWSPEEELPVLGTNMSISQIVEEAHRNAVDKGFWQEADHRGSALEDVPKALCLIHSEVSEALEDYRVAGKLEDLRDPKWSDAEDPPATIVQIRKPVGFASELADVVIRTCDLAGALGIDLGQAVMQKLLYNRTRSHHHGGKRA